MFDFIGQDSQLARERMSNSLPKFINFSSYDINYQPDGDASSITEFMPRHRKPLMFGPDEGELKNAFQCTRESSILKGGPVVKWKTVSNCKLTLHMPYTVDELSGKTLIMDAELVEYITKKFYHTPFEIWVPHIVSIDPDERVANVDFFLYM